MKLTMKSKIRSLLASLALLGVFAQGSQSHAGSVLAWGANSLGQTDVPVEAQSGVIAIAAGGYHTVALKSDGSVLAWGNNYEGETDVPVAAQSGVTAIAAAGSYTMALKRAKTLAEGGIIWNQPLARNGASTDTDPGAGNTLKYRFKLGSTIPIKVSALGINGNDVTGNANITGKIVVFGDTDMDGVVDTGELPIDFNGVGEAGGVMDKIGGKLQFNLDTKKLPLTFKCYILQVTVTDTSTGDKVVETLPLQSK